MFNQKWTKSTDNKTWWRKRKHFPSIQYTSYLSLDKTFYRNRRRREYNETYKKRCHSLVLGLDSLFLNLPTDRRFCWTLSNVLANLQMFRPQIIINCPWSSQFIRLRQWFTFNSFVCDTKHVTFNDLLFSDMRLFSGLIDCPKGNITRIN